MANVLPADIRAILGITATVFDMGTRGIDVKLGTAASDYYYGDAGLDTLSGGDGNDYIEGGTSPVGGVLPEVLNGGAGNDTVGYFNASGAVTVNLVAGLAGTATGADGLDTLLGFENIVGSNYNDTLNGDLNANMILGMGGDDKINGNAGDDKLYGGNGTDTIHGNQGNDQIYGDVGDDKLYGDEGNDTFYFNLGQNSVDGGGGSDTVDYTAAYGAVTIHLDGNSQGATSGGTDTYTSIENVTGSIYGDYLYGNNQANTLIGGRGNDDFWGGGGADTITGGSGKDIYHYESLADIQGDFITQLNFENDTEYVQFGGALRGATVKLTGTDNRGISSYEIFLDGLRAYMSIDFEGYGGSVYSVFHT
jgi:Ca2+-binding RTX toxin-like protein